MKTTLFLLLSILIPHFATGADPGREMTETSTSKQFDPPKEVKAFYLHLLEADLKMKKQFESLTSDSTEANGGNARNFDPQIVKWFPSESHWNVSTGFDSDEVYLVLQPIGFGRGRAAENDKPIASLFHVIITGKTKYDDAAERAGASPTLITNKITSTFLGFQNIELNALKPPKESNSAGP